MNGGIRRQNAGSFFPTGFFIYFLTNEFVTCSIFTSKAQSCQQDRRAEGDQSGACVHLKSAEGKKGSGMK